MGALLTMRTVLNETSPVISRWISAHDLTF